ncbi:MAG: exo-alpha-sialidase [Bryobacterales bacterium]|nr:exo-alpha-sialidase [Bryobacterales bacterium]
MLSASSLAAEVRTEKLFGPETPTGRYKHPACIEQLDNGDLYLVWYGGGGEYAESTAIFASRRPAGSNSWTRPRKIASDPFRSLGNGVIWQGPDKRVWLFYVVRYGETWSSSRIQMKISTDRGETWSDPSVLASEPGMMVRNRPILLANGDYLLPVYHETGDDREVVGPNSTSRFLRFNPKTRQWTESGIIRSPKGNIQPAPVQIDANHLIAYCRRGGGYGPGTEGFLIRSESRDGGNTWTPGVDSKFPNPNSAVDFLRLRNGHLLLIYNHSGAERTPLRVAISTDNDKSYPHFKDIGVGPHDYAYPIVIQLHDGRIAALYTSEKRTQINLTTFDEADILKPQ